MASKRHLNPPRPKYPGSVGTSLGVELAELGRMTSFDKPVRWTLPQGNSIRTADPEEALAAILNCFSLDSIMNRIAGFTRSRETDRPGWTRRLTDAGVHPGTFGPYLMRRLATAAIGLRELPDTSTAQIDVHWLREAFTCLMDVGAFADSKLDELPGTSARRMMQAQIPDQLNLNDYVRELALALESVELATSRGLAVDEAYEERYGLSFRCLVAFCFAAWATIVDESGSGVIDKATWLSRGAINASPTEIEAFFSLCARNFVEL